MVTIFSVFSSFLCEKTLRRASDFVFVLLPATSVLRTEEEFFSYHLGEGEQLLQFCLLFLLLLPTLSFIRYRLI